MYLGSFFLFTCVALSFSMSLVIKMSYYVLNMAGSGGKSRDLYLLPPGVLQREMNSCSRRNGAAHLHPGQVKTMVILLKPAVMIARYFRLGPICVCVVSK